MFRKKAKKAAKKFPVLRALDMAMDSDGVKLLIIMRCCPIVPHAIQNYFMGATAIKMRDFAPTGFFIAPYPAMMIFYGTTLSSIQDALEGNYDMGPGGTAAMIAAVVISLGGFIFLSCVVKRHLNKIVKDQEEADKAKKQAAADDE